MEVLSQAQAEPYQNSAFAFIGTPVKITAGSEKTVWLDRPATVTLQIPKDKRVPEKNADDYLGAYWDGEDWNYIFPDIVKVSEGYITFKTYHFSLFGAVRLTEEEKIRLYTQKMAAHLRGR